MSRSLGHKLMSNYGVVPTPTVRKMSLRSSDTCLIVASDGVWDVMDPTEAVRHVMKNIDSGMSAQQAADELVRCARVLGRVGCRCRTLCTLRPLALAFPSCCRAALPACYTLPQCRLAPSAQDSRRAT